MPEHSEVKRRQISKDAAMTPLDPFHLQRFVDAQAPVLPAFVAELTAGSKRTHWMWFVFPQLRGLGRSSLADFYGIASLDEARAYLAHPELGQRLTDCTERVLAHDARSLAAIFGSPDDLKFHSSMTLFVRAMHRPGGVFAKAIERYWRGELDKGTEALLARAGDREPEGSTESG